MEIIDRIRNRQAVVGVLGLGYVGLPLVQVFSEAGFPVIGFDTDPAKVECLVAGQSYIRHIPASSVQTARDHGFVPTHDFSRATECDAILICVPTPLNEHREPDLRYVIGSCESLSPFVRRGQLYVLESTTYPGTTEEIVRPILQRGGLLAGSDFWLAFSPEREDPGNRKFSTATIPKVVGADDPRSAQAAQSLYGAVIERVIPVSSARAAEATKILENTFRAVNIALVNELKMVFTRMGIDIWEVIDASATKPFGFMKFTPGPGLGGHCIPIDPFYLTWKAREYDLATRFIETAGEINRAMPHWVVERTLETFSDRGRGLSGARVLIVGLAYKKNVDDPRESPSFKLMELFEARGAQVDFHDPFFAAIPTMRHYPQFAGRPSVPLAQAGNYDAVVIATDHDGLDYAQLLQDAALIVDTRGVYPGRHGNVIKA